MSRALKLAARGQGHVSPNPMVGAVLVRRGRLIAEGWHHVFGGPHAEVEVLRAAAAVGVSTKGATLYVTLEPCTHHGKTPPCTDAILAAGITRVVAAMLDPNPNVKGGGGRLLAKRGVTFESGLLENEARHLNAGFVKMAEEGRPLVTLKLASSLDGGIATRSGDSKWITGTPARREAHRLRAGHDAVVVGGATVVADNPELTVRHVRGVNPARIVLDPDLVTSPDARWLENDGVRRILVTARKSSAQKTAAWRAHGAEVWTLATDKNGGIQLKDFVKQAGEAGLLTLLVEGGGRLAGSFLAAGLVDRVRIFTAPLLLGGEARRWTGGLSVNQVDEAPRLKNVRLKRLGTDWQIEGDIEVHGNGEAACSRAS